MTTRLAVLACAGLIASGCGESDAVSRRVVVPAGASVRAAAESLAARNIVASATLFRVYAGWRRDGRSIKAGTYEFAAGAPWRSVLEALRAGDAVVTTVTIPEGLAIGQILPLLAEKLELDPDSLHAAVRDTAWLRRLGVPTESLEGYLFPDTYRFSPSSSERAVVATLLRRFEEVWRPAWTARLDSIRMTRHEVVTLASIIEREARIPDERPVIAGVYMNRLRAGMRLQADPTVQYAHAVHRARVMHRHLEIDSPYNTYRYRGLPPGPIASPGHASIEAALYPATVPYRYFVAFPDGRHEFRRTFAEHLTASSAARRAWAASARSRAAVEQAGLPGRDTSRSRPTRD